MIRVEAAPGEPNFPAAARILTFFLISHAGFPFLSV
jgi:hypothetical protein